MTRCDACHTCMPMFARGRRHILHYWQLEAEFSLREVSFSPLSLIPHLATFSLALSIHTSYLSIQVYFLTYVYICCKYLSKIRLQIASRINLKIIIMLKTFFTSAGVPFKQKETVGQRSL